VRQNEVAAVFVDSSVTTHRHGCRAITLCATAVPVPPFRYFRRTKNSAISIRSRRTSAKPVGLSTVNRYILRATGPIDRHPAAFPDAIRVWLGSQSQPDGPSRRLDGECAGKGKATASHSADARLDNRALHRYFCSSSGFRTANFAGGLPKLVARVGLNQFYLP